MWEGASKRAMTGGPRRQARYEGSAPKVDAWVYQRRILTKHLLEEPPGFGQLIPLHRGHPTPKGLAHLGLDQVFTRLRHPEVVEDPTLHLVRAATALAAEGSAAASAASAAIASGLLRTCLLGRVHQRLHAVLRAQGGRGSGPERQMLSRVVPAQREGEQQQLRRRPYEHDASQPAGRPPRSSQQGAGQGSQPRQARGGGRPRAPRGVPSLPSQHLESGF
eukprot:COSAG01_NODE_200_length_22187_cov_59.140529_6_plen_220_part_00